MSRLPIFVSIPHAGLSVPAALTPYNMLSPAQIAADGDVEAAAIYTLDTEVAGVLRTPIARAFVDCNRARDDIRKDGVFKTHTCWNEPIYRSPPPPEVVEAVLAEHWDPYHERLASLSAGDGLLLAIDGHTMAAEGPPVGPDHGEPRPAVCLGDGDGLCPSDLSDRMLACLRAAFDGDVRRNEPFGGGYITRHHGRHTPWLQIEMARGGPLSPADKRTRLLAALQSFCAGG